MFSNLNKMTAEFIGTAVLTCVVIGSGILSDRLSADNGVSLLAHAISIIAGLTVLMLVLAPISGAHLNPIVSLVNFVAKTQNLAKTVGYIVAQFLGAIFGAVVANLMYSLPAIQISNHPRIDAGTFLGEVIATSGLIAVIGILAAMGYEKYTIAGVAGWVLSAIFFTSSTSFANPALTVAREFSNTFAGISPGSVLPFIAAQLVGGALGYAATRAVSRRTSKA